jgi:sigma-E factor negative regulatory protein RseB
LRRGTALVLLVGAVTLAAFDVRAEDARSWLDRMTKAVEELNYEGTFVHVLGGSAETMNIVHRNEDGQIAERIVSLDGAGREIVRRQQEVQCILPDRKLVLLEQRTDVNPLVSALPSYSEDLEPHYEFALHERARVAERETQILAIKPRDEYRYGYMLWLDADTAMPLKSQLLDQAEQVVEQILFTRIEIKDAIPLAAIEPTTDTAGFTWQRSPLESPAVEHNVPWRASQVPGGFKLCVATQSTIGGARYPVDHLVYSDGLASVSVFIEDPKNKTEVAHGFSSVGSTNAFSLVVGGRQVTAVGEVPRKTVRSIASSLVAQ